MMPFVRGWKTTEFWTSIGSCVLPWLVEGLPATWKVGLSTASTIAYAISRGIAKLASGTNSSPEKK